MEIHRHPTLLWAVSRRKQHKCARAGATNSLWRFYPDFMGVDVASCSVLFDLEERSMQCYDALNALKPFGPKLCELPEERSHDDSLPAKAIVL